MASPLFPRPSSRRTLSLCSSPSFSSSNSSLASISVDETIFSSPTTPLHSGQVPFSWEQIPGIPKNKQKCNDSSLTISLLPLPPAQKTKDHIVPRTQKKHLHVQDPFFAALIECSKGGSDGQADSIAKYFWKTSRITKTLSDRFGFVSMCTNSCKTNCAVTKSMVYLPRSSSSSHDMFHNNNTRGSH